MHKNSSHLILTSYNDYTVLTWTLFQTKQIFQPVITKLAWVRWADLYIFLRNTHFTNFNLLQQSRNIFNIVSNDIRSNDYQIFHHYLDINRLSLIHSRVMTQNVYICWDGTEIGWLQYLFRVCVLLHTKLKKHMITVASFCTNQYPINQTNNLAFLSGF